MALMDCNFHISLPCCFEIKTIKGADIMDLVLVNPKAAGGRSLDKWDRIKPLFREGFHYKLLNGALISSELLKDYVSRGYKNIISAGGDGTLNLILNNLLDSLTPGQLRNIKLGALGIGSSNDFHKPFKEGKIIGGIPAHIDFNSAEPRDVGCLTYNIDGKTEKRYFLINASIGITAEGNAMFNHPGKILSILKKRNTSISILYSAVKTLLGYKNFSVQISSEGKVFETQLTNMGIVKNPCFSGNMKYNSQADYSNGLFDIFLCSSMTVLERINLMKQLSRRVPGKVKNMISWRTAEVNVEAPYPFYVEFDGEMIRTNNVSFSILPKYIKVCRC